MTRWALHGLGGSALLVFLGGAACGPSFQAVYEGERNFEHCYALDETQASVEAKKDCWREWLRGYTYGQSNDRVEYAATRFSQLSLDPMLPSEDVADGGARRPRKADSIALAAPAPTSAFAPPPNMSAVDGHDPLAPGGSGGDTGRTPHVAKDGKDGVRDLARPAGAPGAECLSSCEGRWSGCANGCKDAACEACDKGYRSCVTTCVREGDGGVPTRGRL
jgi:hypothetical protein